MSVLITGASGFYGKKLSLVLKKTEEVIGIVNKNAPSPNIDFLKVDLSDPDLARSVIREIKPKTVFHLASPINTTRSLEAFTNLQAGILDSTFGIALGCLDTGAHLIYLSTCEIYGTNNAPFHEQLIPKPVSAYSALKATAEIWLTTMQRIEGLKVTILRPFLTYGPGDLSKRLIPSAISAAIKNQPFYITDGQQTREVNFIDDMVRDLALFAEKPTGIYNLGGGPEISILGLSRKIFELAGRDPALIRAGSLPRRKGEVERFFGDHSLTNEILGHRTKISLDHGLLLTINSHEH